MKDEGMQIQPVIQRPTLPINYILGNAWEIAKNTKWAVWAVTISILLIVLALNVIFSLIFKPQHGHHGYWIDYVVLPILVNIFIAPFYAGAVMITVKKARKEVVSGCAGYRYTDYYVPTAITLVIIGIICYIPLMIINFPPLLSAEAPIKDLLDFLAGLYSFLIYPFFVLALPLIVDKNFDISNALKVSIQTGAHYWPNIILILLIGYLFIVLTLIPLFIGLIFKHFLLLLLGGAITIIALIWLVPYLCALQGMIYHRLMDQA